MSATDPDSVFNSLVTRYISGELSPGELEQFHEALEKKPALKEQLEQYRKIWASMDALAEQQAYDLDAEWALLQEKMPVSGGGTRDRGRRLLYYSYRVAAVLVAGLLISFALVFAGRMAGTRMAAAEDEAVEVLLKDGSRVMLNRDSKIRYSKDPDGNERRVRLSGEAWFDVARDTTRPFIIDAGTAVVEVLGTSFNVNAYRDNPVVEITVESGIVSLASKQDLLEQIVLRAGNSGTCNRQSSELVLVPSSNPNNISWKTKELYFDHTPLGEAAALVGKVYNVRLEIPDRELALCPITVTFSEQSLAAVLKVLESTLDLEITREGDILFLSGEGCAE